MKTPGTRKSFLQDASATEQKVALPISLTHSPNIFMVFFDSEFTILEVTLGVCQVLGFERAWFIGKKIFQLPFDKTLDLKIQLNQKTAHGFFGKITQCKFRTFENRDITGELLINFSEDEECQTAGMLQLDFSNKPSQEILDNQESLFSKAALEIKEPLRVVSNFWKIIEKTIFEKFEKSEIESIIFIQTNLLKLNHLLNSLLLFEEISAAKLKLTSLNTEVLLMLVKQELKKVDPKIGEKLNLDISLPDEVFGDRVYLRILFYEIIKNAGLFNPNPDLKIWVRATDSGKFWEFEVADNGLGIPEESLKSIFDPLIKLRNTPDTFYSSGMGLALAKKIVELHGGKIKAEQRPVGSGLLIRFSLPKN